MGRRPVWALAIVALVFANATHAGEPASGLGSASSRTPRVTPFEAKAASVARLVAGRPVSIDCLDAASWRALGGRLGFDPALSWAVTPFYWDSELAGPAPDDAARFSPRACRFGASFWLNPSRDEATTCREALQRARVWGVFASRDESACDQWESTLTAVHVLSHESVHLHGVYDETQADCFAVQIDAWVTVALGADEAFAHSMAREYWTDFQRPRIDMYQSADCRDGGSLDLFPDRPGWPTPTGYPADLDSALTALQKRASDRGT